MLPASYTSVLEAKTRDEFRGEVVRFAQNLGFETVTATAVVDQPGTSAEFFSVHNAPSAFIEFTDDREGAKIDPVMQHVKRHSVPIIWDQGTYTSKSLGPMWEQQAQFGYNTGICLALHLPDARHFVIGVDRAEGLPRQPFEVSRMVADLQLFAVYAQDTALRLLIPDVIEAERPRLTPRELETLRWTMEGKTAWEVGAILGISERTAVLHINNAMHKLDATNKHQAVLKALRLGLIR
ncbi:helix-turn-helix transcriptional regulator [Rivibacter subsaxonicus]|uniref:LuxR family transcriptional regulator/LuxR family quorum sensing-dependent transcriptional regulator n=1 Tax=Rivibacter subsaxonicus TaxID=457575 RepID=A0A4Q7VWA4_9BURK|nr:autoinducer binding domain-containing protein [Rivibacter subsaxonicus]RZU00873.1 LuxR family transcriptional regulator/LuxR family quorum sensing-dependent transcriptional regulator [Rivibacter subsaxonicus]